MAKKRIPKIVEKKISEYVAILKKDKLPIKKVILFGSYAKGTQHRWSDIDLCIVSPRFDDHWKALRYLRKKAPFSLRYTIEPVGFTPKDLKDKYDSLIGEIKERGIEIRV